MTSVFAPELVFTILQHVSNICVPNNAHIIIHSTHTGHHVYNSDGIFKLHSDFRFGFIM